ncbi:MAG: hypothetical protein EBZ91_05815 [Gammaproteobacteria bacterium]|nr:hypothetical protein [Gammaproteobacteria bacterium]
MRRAGADPRADRDIAGRCQSCTGSRTAGSLAVHRTAGCCAGDQFVAVGAAVQNLWTAAQALGLGCAWKTGSHAYSDHVLQALGCAPAEKIIGFVHVGVPATVAPVRPAEFADKTRWL